MCGIYFPPILSALAFYDKSDSRIHSHDAGFTISAMMFAATGIQVHSWRIRGGGYVFAGRHRPYRYCADPEVAIWEIRPGKAQQRMRITPDNFSQWMPGLILPPSTA